MVHDVTSRTDLLAPARDMQAEGAQRNAAADAPRQTPDVQATKVDAAELEKAVAHVQQVFQKVEPRLQFEVDNDLHRVIVKIMNGESGEVIRQIPPQEVLDLAKSFQASKGLLLKQEA